MEKPIPLLFYIPMSAKAGFKLIKKKLKLKLNEISKNIFINYFLKEDNAYLVIEITHNEVITSSQISEWSDSAVPEEYIIPIKYEKVAQGQLDFFFSSVPSCFQDKSKFEDFLSAFIKSFKIIFHVESKVFGVHLTSTDEASRVVSFARTFGMTATSDWYEIPILEITFYKFDFNLIDSIIKNFSILGNGYTCFEMKSQNSAVVILNSKKDEYDLMKSVHLGQLTIGQEKSTIIARHYYDPSLVSALQKYQVKLNLQFSQHIKEGNNNLEKLKHAAYTNLGKFGEIYNIVFLDSGKILATFVKRESAENLVKLKYAAFLHTKLYLCNFPVNATSETVTEFLAFNKLNPRKVSKSSFITEPYHFLNSFKIRYETIEEVDATIETMKTAEYDKKTQPFCLLDKTKIFEVSANIGRSNAIVINGLPTCKINEIIDMCSKFGIIKLCSLRKRKQLSAIVAFAKSSAYDKSKELNQLVFRGHKLNVTLCISTNEEFFPPDYQDIQLNPNLFQKNTRPKSSKNRISKKKKAFPNKETQAVPTQFIPTQPVPTQPVQIQPVQIQPAQPELVPPQIEQTIPEKRKPNIAPVCIEKPKKKTISFDQPAVSFNQVVKDTFSEFDF